MVRLRLKTVFCLVLMMNEYIIGLARHSVEIIKRGFKSVRTARHARWEQRRTFAPRSSRYPSVGAASLIRVSSSIFPALLRGTFRSALTYRQSSLNVFRQRVYTDAETYELLNMLTIKMSPGLLVRTYQDPLSLELLLREGV